jgi:hypothetical protein
MKLSSYLDAQPPSPLLYAIFEILILWFIFFVCPCFDKIERNILFFLNPLTSRNVRKLFLDFSDLVSMIAIRIHFIVCILYSYFDGTLDRKYYRPSTVRAATKECI